MYSSFKKKKIKWTRNERQKKREWAMSYSSIKLEGNKMKSKAKIKKKERIRVLHQKCVSHTVKPVLILNIKP